MLTAEEERNRSMRSGVQPHSGSCETLGNAFRAGELLLQESQIPETLPWHQGYSRQHGAGKRDAISLPRGIRNVSSGGRIKALV